MNKYLFLPILFALIVLVFWKSQETGSYAVILPQTNNSVIKPIANQLSWEVFSFLKDLEENKTINQRSNSREFDNELSFHAERINGQKYKSLVLEKYQYEGGANGTSSYHVYTYSNGNSKRVSLDDIIKPESKNEFLQYIKSALNKYRIKGDNTPILFEDSIKQLTFEDLNNWSMDNENVMFYFDKYQIGPGVLGSFIFKLPIKDLSSFFE